MLTLKFEQDSRDAIRDAICTVLERIDRDAYALQAELDTLPRHIDAKGDYEYDEPEEAKLLQRNIDQLAEIDDRLTKELDDIDDLYSGRTDYHYPDANPPPMSRSSASITRLNDCRIPAGGRRV